MYGWRAASFEYVAASERRACIVLIMDIFKYHLVVGAASRSLTGIDNAASRIVRCFVFWQRVPFVLAMSHMAFILFEGLSVCPTKSCRIVPPPPGS